MDVHIEAKNVTLLPNWEEKINEEIAKIQRHFPDLIHHLRFELIGTKHHRLGYVEIHIVASVPGETIVVKRKGERVQLLLVECFDKLDRQIREYNRRRQGIIKSHEMHPVGSIKRIFREEGYGFLEGADGEEIYFQQSAVKTIPFKDLEVGDLVRYEGEQREKGPQAIWIKPAR
ncbi:Sigma 54 modulation protein YhbH [Dissulfuribacter thermophilus]|uniref:Sigma 54 modulation protein YhbH n=1 Tax=Dissulfuribacter thermophilus TaxID=1156395 RepID=A0A1B9F7U2_9BACT|nr:HPF/RaiA family ribosome-associated protein [Dissulfuribacter thermophilus]OCC16007.1 Sigma 54 modulation protein YhbH [Dissulfuribacter thermophilus]